MSATTTIPTDRQKWLREICENPREDLPRLAFADWIESRGEEQYAEFIRAQIEIPKLLAISERWVNTPSNQPGGTKEDGGPAGAALGEAGVLENRVEKLWDNNKTRWFGDRDAIWCKSEEEFSETVAIYPDLSVALVSRGFFSRVRCTLDQWRGLVCDMCAGLGWHSQPHRYQQRCDDCNGEGLTPGIGPRIAQRNPVEFVEVVGMEPHQIYVPIETNRVGVTTMKAKYGYWPDVADDNEYETIDDAKKGLSDWLIRWARQQSTEAK